MSEVTYKKIVDVEQIDALGEGTTLFVNDGGSMKQMGAGVITETITGLEEQVSALTEEIEDKQPIGDYAKSVNGFAPDNDGAVMIKYNRSTEKDYNHTVVSSGGGKKITVYDNDLHTAKPYVFLGKNYWPITEYLAGAYTQHGLTYASDKHNITVIGTSTIQSEFMLSPDGEESYWPIPDDLVAGDMLRVYLFGVATTSSNLTAKALMYDAHKNYISMSQAFINSESDFSRAGSLTITENAKYLRFQIAYKAAMEYNHTIFPVLVKNSDEILDTLDFADGEIEYSTDNISDEICSAPYKCAVEYTQNLKDYIDHLDSDNADVDIDMTQIDSRRSFVTPEMFGAKADGATDDTSALQACIDYAVDNNIKLVAGKNYVIDRSLIISGNALEMSFHSLVYNGDDAAIIFSGSNCDLRITSIWAKNGCGLRIKSTISTHTNNIYTGYISSSKNCIELACISYFYNNRITFGYLRAGNDWNCIYHDASELDETIDTFGNNLFYGGHLTSGKWGVYNARGNDLYEGCQFEGVKNGIHYSSIGAVRVIGARYAELIQLAYDETQNQAIEGQGVLLAIESHFGDSPTPGGKDMEFELMCNGCSISPWNIDISKNQIETVSSLNGKIYPLSKNQPGANATYEKLRNSTGEPLADDFLILGRNILIKHPTLPRRKNLTANDTGYTGSYRVTGNLSEFEIYDTFIVSEAGCDYTLPPSYDSVAYAEFRIIQHEGASCIFRDWLGNVIFDGATYGTGSYTLRARLANDSMYDYIDNSNQAWDIYKNGEYMATTMPPAIEQQSDT